MKGLMDHGIGFLSAVVYISEKPREKGEITKSSD